MTSLRLVSRMRGEYACDHQQQASTKCGMPGVHGGEIQAPGFAATSAFLGVVALMLSRLISRPLMLK